MTQKVKQSLTPPRPRLVILDRDGVINEDSDHYIRSIAEWRPVPGSPEAIGGLCRAGMQVAIASNQSGLARGYFDLRALNEMHGKLLAEVARHEGRIEHLAFCPHLPEDDCECRKPANGMLRLLLERFGLSPNEALFVGDTHKDFLAADSLGIPFVLVQSGKGERELWKHSRLRKEVWVFRNLAAVSEALQRGGRT